MTTQYLDNSVLNSFASGEVVETIKDTKGNVTKVNYTAKDSEQPLELVKNTYDENDNLIKQEECLEIDTTDQPTIEKNIYENQYDSHGNDLTSQIVVLGSVDVDKAGRYELTYQVADSFNNVTIVTRVVEVVENDDDQDINVQPGDDSNPNGTTGTNGTTSASVNTPFTGDLVNSNYLTLAIASLMTFILMIKKYLKDLKNNH